MWKTYVSVTATHKVHTTAVLRIGICVTVPCVRTVGSTSKPGIGNRTVKLA